MAKKCQKWPKIQINARDGQKIQMNARNGQKIQMNARNGQNYDQLPEMAKKY